MEKNLFFSVLTVFYLLSAVPAEAGAKSGSMFEIGAVVMIAGVVVLALIMKRFMR